jgi:hypothetical protein
MLRLNAIVALTALDWSKGKASVIWLDGGADKGDPCQAGGHHGFAGLDGQVVNAVVNFAR